MNPTSISWCLGPDGKPGFTWNPFAGCKRISQGCVNCYAARLAATRLSRLRAYKGLAREGERRTSGAVFAYTGEVRFFPEKLAEPLRKRAPAGIFVGDMGDIALLPYQQLSAVFGIMAALPRHRFYVLTKRPALLRSWFEEVREQASRPERFGHVVESLRIPLELAHWAEAFGHVRPVLKAKIPQAQAWPLPNVFVGTSVCTQDDADKNIIELAQISAALRFLSVEPLLEHVDLGLLGVLPKDIFPSYTGVSDRIDWVIVGGESGPKARPCSAEWILSIVRDCDGLVPCFVKQLGANCTTRNDDNFTADEGDPAFPKWPDHLTAEGRVVEVNKANRYQGAPVRIRPRDRAGADMSEWRSDMRIRQMPEVRR